MTTDREASLSPDIQAGVAGAFGGAGIIGLVSGMEISQTAKNFIILFVPFVSLLLSSTLLWLSTAIQKRRIDKAFQEELKATKKMLDDLGPKASTEIRKTY